MFDKMLEQLINMLCCVSVFGFAFIIWAGMHVGGDRYKGREK